MRHSRGRVAAAALLAGAAFKVGGHFAEAATSYEGSDYSLGTNNNYLKVCDKESDGHQVHNDITWIGGGSSNNFLTDDNGNNDNCPATNVLDLPVFNTHRVVEAVPFLPDQFGPWVSAT